MHEQLLSWSGRADHIGKKMVKFASSHNSLVDAHNDQSKDLIWLKVKVADSKDRSRRNNIKIRGVPGAIQPAQLQQYARDLKKAFLPSIPESALAVDRIHRLPKPSHLPDNIPRDVLMWVHFYNAKEQLMTSFRKNLQPPEKFSNIQLYAELSQYTMQKRKSLLPVTKALCNHSNVYRWGYPTKLTITHDGNNLNDHKFGRRSSIAPFFGHYTWTSPWKLISPCQVEHPGWLANGVT